MSKRYGAWAFFGLFIAALVFFGFAGPVTLMAILILWGLVGSLASVVTSGNPLRSFCNCIGMFGILAFIGFFVVVAYKPSGLRDVELPNADANTLATDRAGSIYVASPAFGRIQKYDSSGQFLFGWFVDSGNGHLHVTADDLVEVCAARSHILSVFRPDGTLVPERSGGGCDNSATFAPTSVRTAASELSIHGRLYYPSVVGQRSDGTPIDIRPPLVLLPWFHPFVAFAIGAVGMGLAQVFGEGRKTL